MEVLELLNQYIHGIRCLFDLSALPHRDLRTTGHRGTITSKVPAKPAWYGRLAHVVRELQAQPRPFVDRATIEFLLGVGRRRAQQIMAPCITDRVGANGLADRDALIDRLRRLADGDDGFYEVQRQRRVADVIQQLRKERVARPQLLVEAPLKVINQEFQDLPEGVQIEPGRITIEFGEPHQALEKLLALAMAISNDFDRFYKIASGE